MNIPPANPAQRAWLIAPSDTQLVAASVSGVPYARGILVSADCTLHVTTLGGDQLTIPFIKGYNPIAVQQVWATGSSTNGALLIGLY
ncbi:hypothetical protein CWRG_02672 [Chthonomonas calidirosea]|uniref:Uncharacterized protein n=1 Tax=Chthonomonas calidirosea (strain DSM 23976 / ICMP 18418 / T49) TaxID=1303518 RepID=S0EY22_CHTCT|nr:hypothetical protein [Chthonomonas calidirosea]CCW35218.1 hypothetical protein CCALI_01401 [Chthonomonas calidirosea T49]CEK19950.1 hypothetical protein CWRG_02672 [Chthonomonas calidirosea]CEK19952.1 hypothetical protein CP488_02695 [Chthonomonas calidirosea]CEK20764.1 hypothetical protein CTKA_02697 [Chthonomonas calidirosea]